MKKYTPEQIRNVALVSHGGAGKTSLAEAMLFITNAINRLGSVDAGNTTMDFDEEEAKKQITINTSLSPVEWKDTKINFLDTPGYFDFLGEVKAALRAADAATVVVSAVNGVEVGTEKVWEYSGENNLPRMIFVNKLDRENASFSKTMEQLENFFGHKVVPLQIPWGEEANFKGVIDLLNQKAYTFDQEGKEVKEEEIPQEYQDQFEEMREKMVEVAAENDDELLMKYLEGESLSEEELWQGLKTGVREQGVFPVALGSATQCYGIQHFLDLVSECLPSPLERGEITAYKPGSDEEVTVSPDPDGAFSALVFKTQTDPYVGRINYFKVISGSISPDMQVLNPRKDRTEKIGQVFYMRGKNQIQEDKIVTGDIACTSKLQVTGTGDTLCDRSSPVQFPQMDFPEPVISFSVESKAKGDEEKVGTGLSRFTDEDPTFKVERRTETKEMVISGMGEMHLEVIVNKLRQKFGVDVELKTPRVPYKETIKKNTRVENKYKKQSGGRGQYGHVFLELEPLEYDKGFEFEEKIFGGVVPKQYIPAVEKGISEAMEEGHLAGYPVVGVKATLYDGSYHTVDSSEMAFKIAASQAFKQGMEQADAVLLEPVMEVEVTVPESYMGDIMGDLNSRRGRILGMDPSNGVQTIRALVPMAEMFRYAIDLRSMTQGRGFFTMKFKHYEEVPSHISEQVIEAAAQEKSDKES